MGRGGMLTFMFMLHWNCSMVEVVFEKWKNRRARLHAGSARKAPKNHLTAPWKAPFPSSFMAYMSHHEPFLESLKKQCPALFLRGFHVWGRTWPMWSLGIKSLRPWRESLAWETLSRGSYVQLRWCFYERHIFFWEIWMKILLYPLVN